MKDIMIMLAVVLAVLFSVPPRVYADRLFLDNGRTLEGIITRGDSKYIELQVSSAGSVKFSMSRVVKIEKNSFEHNELVRQKWEKDNDKRAERIQKLKSEEESRPKDVEFSKDGQTILLNVMLNGKTEARLVMDTGASVVTLSRKVAEKLGFDLSKVKPDMKIKVADGREVNAKRILLDSVKIQDAEAQKIDAAVLMEEVGSMQADGLLGMSFLKKFNMKIDHVAQKLTLEKI